MDINRNNYETWLIDFLDGKLNTEEEAGMRLFLTQNPDIQEEFEYLESVQLEVENIVFEPKDSLKKKQIQPIAAIDENTFEDYFIAATENDLTSKERRDVAKFLQKNPFLQKDYELQHSAFLKADDSISFQGKEQLKKKDNRRIIWLASAVSTAAVILLLIGLGIQNWPIEKPPSRFSSKLQWIPSKADHKLVTEQAFLQLHMDVTKTNILITPALPEERIPAHIDKVVVKQIHYQLAQLNRPDILEQKTDYDVLYASADAIPAKKKGMLARIIENNRTKIRNQLVKSESKLKNQNDKKEPFLIRLIDKSLLVFNTVTGGNQSVPIKTYNQNGELTRYQLEGDIVKLDRVISTPNSAE